MLHTILVGLDGSPCADSAVELGIRWATRVNALLVGLGVVDQPAICPPEAASLGGSAYKEHRDEVLLNRARRQVDGLLESFALRCANAGVSAKVLEDEGAPLDQILREAQRYDLVLLGQETHFHFATQDDPCDTAQKVAKNCPRPLVIVPRVLTPGTHVVIAYDGSLQSARALQSFQSLGFPDSIEVHVVTVGSEHAAAVAHAERALDYLHNHGRKASRHVVISPSPAEALLEQARLLKAGLIVMGAYGKPFLREFFFGSVTRTLLRTSEIPLFLEH